MSINPTLKKLVDHLGSLNADTANMIRGYWDNTGIRIGLIFDILRIRDQLECQENPELYKKYVQIKKEVISYIQERIKNPKINKLDDLVFEITVVAKYNLAETYKTLNNDLNNCSDDEKLFLHSKFHGIWKSSDDPFLNRELYLSKLVDHLENLNADTANMIRDYWEKTGITIGLIFVLFDIRDQLENENDPELYEKYIQIKKEVISYVQERIKNPKMDKLDDLAFEIAVVAKYNLTKAFTTVQNDLKNCSDDEKLFLQSKLRGIWERSDYNREFYLSKLVDHLENLNADTANMIRDYWDRTGIKIGLIFHLFNIRDQLEGKNDPELYEKYIQIKKEVISHFKERIKDPKMDEVDDLAFEIRVIEKYRLVEALGRLYLEIDDFPKDKRAELYARLIGSNPQLPKRPVDRSGVDWDNFIEFLRPGILPDSGTKP